MKRIPNIVKTGAFVERQKLRTRATRGTEAEMIDDATDQDPRDETGDVLDPVIEIESGQDHHEETGTEIESVEKGEIKTEAKKVTEGIGSTETETRTEREDTEIEMATVSLGETRGRDAAETEIEIGTVVKVLQGHALVRISVKRWHACPVKRDAP